MPIFKVEFVRRTYAIVEAESAGEAREAGELTVEDGFDDWMMDAWEVDYVCETSEEPTNAIMKNNVIGHIDDACPADERDKLLCEHGNDVDLLGRGCPECEGEQT